MNLPVDDIYTAQSLVNNKQAHQR